MSKIACITGDVHHDLGNSEWDRYEPAYALEFARIINKKEAKGTLFITGKCAERSPYFTKRIHEFDCIEIGAHTYRAFKFLPTIIPRGGFQIRYKRNIETLDLRNLPHHLMSVISGSFYGPLWIQKRDVARTVRALEKIGVSPISWRTHSYASDQNTHIALDDHGFFVISDEHQNKFDCYREHGDLWQMPIVGPKDDEMVRPNQSNEEYRRQFFDYINRASKRNEPVVFQMHPKRQAMLGFDHLRKAVDRLHQEGYQFMTISEAATELTGKSSS